MEHFCSGFFFFQSAQIPGDSPRLLHFYCCVAHVIWMDHGLFSHLPVEGHGFFLFQFLTIINKAAIRICVQVSV